MCSRLYEVRRLVLNVNANLSAGQELTAIGSLARARSNIGVRSFGHPAGLLRNLGVVVISSFSDLARMNHGYSLLNLHTYAISAKAASSST